jgi:hypothetical protein
MREGEKLNYWQTGSYHNPFMPIVRYGESLDAGLRLLPGSRQLAQNLNFTLPRTPFARLK